MNDEEARESFLAPAGGGDAEEAAVSAVEAVAEPRAAAEDAGYGGVDGADAPAESAAPPESAGDDGFGEFDWPEGYAADPKAMAKFVPLARSLGLGKEKAQRLATLYAELDQERHRAQAEFIAKNNAEWLREIHAHPEFGGDALSRTAENVASVMRRFGSPLLARQVRQMNVQNWPEMFFFLARVSKAVAEDCSPSGGVPDAPGRSAAQILFPGLR